MNQIHRGNQCLKFGAYEVKTTIKTILPLVLMVFFSYVLPAIPALQGAGYLTPAMAGTLALIGQMLTLWGLNNTQHKTT